MLEASAMCECPVPQTSHWDSLALLEMAFDWLGYKVPVLLWHFQMMNIPNCDIGGAHWRPPKAFGEGGG